MSQCHIKVVLTKVTYQGDDIGNDWEYAIRILSNPNGRWVRIPLHTLNHGASENRNDVLYESIRENCDQQFIFRVALWAKEHDLFFDDFARPSIHPNTGNISLNCPNVNVFPFVHKVNERFTLFGTDTAQLKFDIQFLLYCND
ncbi:hypothetical protein [Winogradskyella sp.]|uniref:hypothetical protein n=1 Tax=Winogradskyella sp. TaxID=1883156 RepID=UPI002614CA2E|nr:hypothetical protein [Winogradskyella sp.]